MNDHPDRIGRYRILGELGKGGMGIVYLAEGEDDGARVALKTVLVPAHELLGNIRREIHALARLHHPGIVSILAEGIENGLPWYAMEVLTGRSLDIYWTDLDVNTPRPVADRGGWPRPLPVALAATIADTPVPRAGGDEPTPVPLPKGAKPPLAERNPAALRQSLEVVHRLCIPLAFMHGEGIVHRDLKPENVLVRPDGTPVLVDLGLMSRFWSTISREALEVDRGVAGTVAYMAPEQVRGELVDARADLYSLGCMLYRLATGRAPFVGECYGDVLQQHLRKKPVLPSLLANHLPRELESLILRLLEKRPEERPGYALDVANALAPLTGIDTAELLEVAPRPYLYRPGFTGRAAMLEELEGRLLRLEQQSGALALIAGESGIGKTRFAMEVARRSIERDILVLMGECLAPSEASEQGSPPLYPFRRILGEIADECREEGEPACDRLFGKSARVLARYAPSVAALPGLEKYAEPASLPPEQARLRVFADLAEVLRRVSDERPLLLILDDLQWADELTAGFLSYLLRGEHLRRMELVIVATYRAEERTDAIAALRGHEQVLELSLGRLDEAAVGAIVANMLAITPPPSLFSRFLAQYSEGNPFFVGEYLRAAVEEGILWRDHGGHWQVLAASDEAADWSEFEALPLPRNLQDLVERRLTGLTGPARRLLEVAAVLGRDVETAFVSQLAKVDDYDFFNAQQTLLRRQVLEEAGGGWLRFTHDKIREVAYAKLDEGVRRQLHSESARRLRARFGVAVGEAEAEIARHHDAAGEANEAVPAYVLAARHARESAALPTAIGFLDRALALCGQGLARERLAIHLERARVLDLHGAGDRALLDLEEALRLAMAAGDERARCDALLERAAILLRRSDPRGTQESAAAAAALAEALGDRALGVRALNFLGAAQWRQGDGFAASLTLADALVMGRTLASPALLAQTLHYLGAINQERGDFQKALAYHQQALEARERSGDEQGAAAVLTDLALVSWRQGDLREALDRTEQARQMYEHIGDRVNIANTLGNLGGLMIDRGELRRAFSMFEKAHAMYRGMGNEGGALRNLGNMAIVEREQGELGKALERFRTVLAARRASADPHELALALHNIAAVLVDCGAFAEAAVIIGEGVAICRRLEDRFHLAESLTTSGEIAWFGGDAEGAARCWQEALQLARSNGYRLLELPLKAWVAMSRPRLGSADAAEVDEGEELLAVSQELGGADLVSEVGVLVADRELSRAAPQPAAALRAANQERLAMVERDAARQLYYAEWLRHRALAASGQHDAAEESLRAACEALASVVRRAPEPYVASLLRHPRAEGVVAAARERGLELGER
ncbi:MAG: tetratricopeptide repeat protein [Candidatus Schekmanbacteria bacterium]|nr:tetratricopeptide repeat protein [Candidatus Schekmanbacteria bacterium]